MNEITEQVFQFGSKYGQYDETCQKKGDLGDPGPVAVKDMLVEDDDGQGKSDIEYREYLNKQDLQKGFLSLEEIVADGKDDAHQ